MDTNNIYDFSKRTIRQSFYSFLTSRYPLATKGDINLLIYIINGQAHNIYLSHTVIPYQTIGRLYSVSDREIKIGFKSTIYLDQFQKHVEPLNIIAHEYNNHLARAVRVEWPLDVMIEIQKEMMFKSSDVEKLVSVPMGIANDLLLKQIFDDLLTIINSGQVYWDGTPCNSLSAQERIKQQHKEVKQIMRANKLIRRQGDISKKMVTYLNGLPSYVFAKAMKDNYRTAVEWASHRYKIGEIDQHQLLMYFRYLSEIHDYMMPVVKPVENSSRVYPASYSLMTTPSELRKILTKGWTELDLKSCQLAVAAKLWNIPSILSLLEEGTHIWKHIASEMGVEYTDEIKKQIKTGVYSLVYGGTLKQLDHVFLSPKLKLSFLSVKIIQDLKRVSAKQLSKIRKAGRAENALGQLFQLKNINIEDGKKPERSLLAQINQSYETKMLEPAFNLAIKHRNDEDGFYIALYQYDGISIVAKNPDKQDYWVSRVKEVVNNRIKEMGFVTELI